MFLLIATKHHHVTENIALGLLSSFCVQLCLGKELEGLLLTFEQPLRIPGAEQPQGVLPRLKPPA